MPVSTSARPDSTAHLDDVATTPFVDPTTAVTSTPMPRRPSPEAPTQRTTHTSDVRTSVTSGPPTSIDGKPQRKKSSLRSVLRQIFGRKAKKSTPSDAHSDGLRAGQHRSVSVLLCLSTPQIDNFRIQRRSTGSPKARPIPNSALHLYPSMSSIEHFDLT